MTASTVKSTMVTNMDAKPVDLTKPSKWGGELRVYSETIEAATTSLDETGDIIRMIRIPSNLVPTSILIFNDDLDSNGTPALTFDCGIYNPAKPDGSAGAVIDADCFAAAQTTLQAANVGGVELLTKTMDIAKIGKEAWDIAGSTSDPGGYLDIALTVVTAAGTAAAGTITVVVRGVSNR